MSCSIENNKIKRCFETIEKYNFKEAADMIMYLIGYFESDEDYKEFVEILKKMFELL